MDSVLRMEHISKSFPGVRALDDVSFELRQGEIQALLGHNGAGKSTLVKIIAGAYQRDAGEMYLDGQAVNFTRPSAAIQAGIHMVYQELDLLPHLSGAENIYLGQGRFHSRLGLINHHQKLNAARELVKRLDVEIDLAAPVGEQSISKQQIIAIAKAISSNAKIIILDEPTSALNDNETRKLFEIMRRLVSEGVSLVLITHRLDEVFEIADWVIVMRDGHSVLSRNVKEVTKKDIIDEMTGGEAPRAAAERRITEFDKVVLECEHLSASKRFQDISFKLHFGEVLGLTGLIGCGATEVARAIYGADPRDSGRVLVNNLPAKAGNTTDAARKGLAFVPEDRKSDGLVLIESTRNNLTLSILNQLTRFGFVNRKLESAKSRQMISSLSIRVASEHQVVGTLSGGNQQKVVLSKWLLKESPILLLCEPTRGIDVATKSEIHYMIRDIAANGFSVLVVSSELDEILDTCDRVLVMYEGKIFGELTSSEFDRTKILDWMYGVHKR